MTSRSSYRFCNNGGGSLNQGVPLPSEKASDKGLDLDKTEQQVVKTILLLGFEAALLTEFTSVSALEALCWALCGANPWINWFYPLLLENERACPFYYINGRWPVALVVKFL